MLERVISKNIQLNLEEFQSHYMLFNKAIAIIKDLKGIEGICLSGSFARGEANELSDLDLILICDNDNFNNLWAYRNTLQDLIGKVIFRIDIDKLVPFSSIVFYSEFLKLHLTFINLANPRIDAEFADIVILEMKNNAINKWHQDSIQLSKSLKEKIQPNIHEWFWFWIINAVNKSIQGEYWASYDFLNKSREILVVLMSKLQNIDHHGFRFIEKTWKKKWLIYLEETISTVNPESLAKNMIKILELYDDCIEQLRIPKNSCESVTNKEVSDYCKLLIKERFNVP